MTHDKSRIGIALIFALLLIPLHAGAQTRTPGAAAAQPKTTPFWIFQDVTIGPYFTAGVSRQNENLPEASTITPWHSSARFAYMIGGMLDFSINPWIGFDFSALYDSRDLYLANSGDSDNIDLSLGYVAFQPSIRIFWLLVGLAFDLPMSGSATMNIAAYQHYDKDGKPDVPVTAYTNNLNVATSDLSSLTEVRASLSIPILQEEDAELHLIVSGSYPLANALSGTKPSFDTTYDASGIGHFSGPSAPGQGPLPTVEAGLSYQFDLLH